MCSSINCDVNGNNLTRDTYGWNGDGFYSASGFDSRYNVNGIA
jgi:hypothetical protein